MVFRCVPFPSFWQAAPMNNSFGDVNPYGEVNPYASPVSYAPPRRQREQAPGSLLAAGMALVLVAGIGLAVSIYNFVFSFGQPHIDPNAPEFVREIQRGAVGPVATALQGGFMMLNLFIIACAVQMMKLKSWGMGVTGSVLAMINIGSCCCAAGIPVGLWSLAVLTSPDVMTIFSATKSQDQSA
jgi:hypothetical protein